MALSAPSGVWRSLLAQAGDDWRPTPFYRLTQKAAEVRPIQHWAEDPRSGDVVRGFDLALGQWRIGAERLEGVHPNPWRAHAPSDHFRARLHGFSWLRDLIPVGVAGQEMAANLIAAWVDEFGEWHASAWAPELTAERLFAWLAYARAAFELSTLKDRTGVFRAFNRQARHLRAALGDIRDPMARLKAGAALAMAGAALMGPDREGRAEALQLCEHGVEALEEELAKQFLQDGGHASRAPEFLLEAYTDLNVAQAMLSAQNIDGPSLAADKAPRMAAMLRFFQMSDGGLAAFNGGGEGSRSALRAALDPLDRLQQRAPMFRYATHSGYQRLFGADTTLIMDVGAAPDPAFGERAHAGALSFEMSCGPDRLIINVGSARDLHPDWRAAGRMTNGHSTLIIKDELSCQFAQRRMGLNARGAAHPIGPTNIYAKRTEEDDGAWIDAHHDGYRAHFGLLHRRRVYMRADGREVRGQDAVAPPLGSGAAKTQKGAPFAIRFHIHPAVRVERSDVRAITLTPPNGPAWRFITDANEMAIEKSVYLGGPQTPDPRARQIVLRGEANPALPEDQAPNLVRWKLQRMA